MTFKYGKFQLPTQIKVEESSKTVARFIAEPFERGFGHTIGNALRRIMLTSLESPSIVSIKMEGVPHEYMAIEGVIEDMTRIVLNLKKALLRKLPTTDEPYSRDQKIVSKTLEVTQEMIDSCGGQYRVTLKDLLGDCGFEIVNPDLLVFNVTKPLIRKVSIKIAISRGYVPSERHQIPDKLQDEIVIDSAFSPVRLVNYYVEHTRVGQDTDYDRVVLYVVTDGRITPEEALAFASQIGVSHLKVFEELKFLPLTFDTEELQEDSDRDQMFNKLSQKINEIELSVRSTNCLSQASIETIAELVIMPESEMLKFRNFGKKSLNEIKEKLDEMGLFLGMDLSKYGLTRENVKQSMKQYIEEKSRQEV